MVQILISREISSTGCFLSLYIMQSPYTGVVQSIQTVISGPLISAHNIVFISLDKIFSCFVYYSCFV